MMNFSSSLVKYSTPVLISTGVKKDSKENGGTVKAKPMTNYYDKKDSKVDKTINIWDWIVDMEEGQTIEEILNTIIPPREHHQESQGQQEELNKRLKQRKANETGICPIREELFSQCFDELIRQVIISYKKRGLLLACVRDQYALTVDSYRNLYESSIAFGIRKAVNADKYKSELKSKIEVAELDCNKLQREVDALRAKIDNAKKTQEENRKVDSELRIETGGGPQERRGRDQEVYRGAEGKAGGPVEQQGESEEAEVSGEWPSIHSRPAAPKGLFGLKQSLVGKHLHPDRRPDLARVTTWRFRPARFEAPMGLFTSSELINSKSKLIWTLVA